MIKACSRDNAAWSIGASPTEARCSLASWSVAPRLTPGFDLGLQARAASQNVRDVFYCRTSAWQESVMARGLQRLKVKQTLAPTPWGRHLTILPLTPQAGLTHLGRHGAHPLPAVTTMSVN